MFNKAVFPGKYIQGVGAIGELPALIDSLGKKGLILASPSVKSKVLPGCGIDWSEQVVPIELFRGECCQSELGRLFEIVTQTHVDVLVGMGGGKTIDTAKVVADRAGIPVIIIPTIASTDATCSRRAVLYSEDGIFASVCYQKTSPAVVLVDVGIIAAAPTRFLVAGMGDALSTWFEARSCERTRSPNECGGYSTKVGLFIAKFCYETLLTYGAAVKAASERHIVTPALDHIVEANILLSGIGFESAGLAAAHAIHNGLTALTETHSFYHGEKVAFGVLAGLQLTDASADESAAAFSFCEAVGLPTTLADIGLGNADRQKLMEAALKACAPGQSIHHEAGMITPEMSSTPCLRRTPLVRKEEVTEVITGREGFSDPGFSRGDSEPGGSGAGGPQKWLAGLPILSCGSMCGPLAFEWLNHRFGSVAFPGVSSANSTGISDGEMSICLVLNDFMPWKA